MVLNVKIVPILSDNFCYILYSEKNDAVVVDPANAKAVLAAAKAEGITLTKILTTHKHWDHAGGNNELLRLCPSIDKVYGGAIDNPEAMTNSVVDGEEFTLCGGEAKVRCLLTPGHTRGHICFYIESASNADQHIVFTGDCLFVGGAGKFFEGSPSDMFGSLTKLAALPNNTLVYCGHEYTVSNYKFAVNCDENRIRGALDSAMATIQSGKHTIPSSIGQEKETNLFLRAVAFTLSENSVVATNVKANIQDSEDATASAIALLGAIRSAKDRRMFG